jgi:hypothetical protein
LSVLAGKLQFGHPPLFEAGYMKRSFLAASLVGVTLPSCACAADISVQGNKIIVAGTIEAGDFDRFYAKTQPYDQAMTVHLHSAGGFIVPALKIGLMIRQKGWTTSVEHICNSACAFIWLAGVMHLKTEDAYIGVHSPFDLKTGKPNEASSSVTTLYLKGLGYGEQLTNFILATPPHKMKSLTRQDAARFGVAVMVVAPSLPKNAFAGINLRKRPDLPKVVPGSKQVEEAARAEAERLKHSKMTAPSTVQLQTLKPE